MSALIGGISESYADMYTPLPYDVIILLDIENS
jgi:hypothetical protein